MSKIVVRNAFSRDRVSFATTGKSRTLQAFKDECDVNRILAKYQKTGAAEFLEKYKGQYGDFVGAPDFEEAQNVVASAQSMFEDLPSEVRARFENRPAAFLEFVHDPENAKELVSMGLAKPDRTPTAVETPSPIAKGGSTAEGSLEPTTEAPPVE